jgi:hypothetical protein
MVISDLPLKGKITEMSRVSVGGTAKSYQKEDRLVTGPMHGLKVTNERSHAVFIGIGRPQPDVGGSARVLGALLDVL